MSINRFITTTATAAATTTTTTTNAAITDFSRKSLYRKVIYLYVSTEISHNFTASCITTFAFLRAIFFSEEFRLLGCDAV
jgi:hypothetical protein